MVELVKKFCNRETISYLIFGILTTIVNQVTFEICKFMGVNYVVSTIIAWILAVSFAYITNKLFVFESKSWETSLILKEISSFVACRLFSGACDLGFMVFAVEYIHINDSLAKLCSNVFVVIINYVFSKLFIFKKKS